MDSNVIFGLSASITFLTIFVILYTTKPESMTRIKNGKKRVCMIRVFFVSLILSLILASGIYVYNSRNNKTNFSFGY